MSLVKNFTLKEKSLAWAVHAFTASGIVAGFFAMIAIDDGNAFMAFALLFLAIVIDGIDGTFARMFRTTEVLPHVSGKTMDYVIDFATYAIIPTYFIYMVTLPSGEYLIPDGLRGITATIILLVSVLYYGHENMVSEDMYFVGFPVMWNFVAFYLYYVLILPPIVNFLIIIILAIMHFVPIKYLYPSRTMMTMPLNIIASFAIMISNFTLMFFLEFYEASVTVILIARIISMVSLTYFALMSFYHTYLSAKAKKAAVETHTV